MRKNKKTITLAKIRKLIRRKARQYNLGNEIGSLTFWDKEDYKRAKKVSRNKNKIGIYPYYSKSTRAIEDLAKEIFDACNVQSTMGKILLVKWKGDPSEDEKHRYDFRWIKDKKERDAWIRKNWVVKEEDDAKGEQHEKN